MKIHKHSTLSHFKLSFGAFWPFDECEQEERWRHCVVRWAGRKKEGPFGLSVWGSTHLFNRGRATRWAFEAKDWGGLRTETKPRQSWTFFFYRKTTQILWFSDSDFREETEKTERFEERNVSFRQKVTRTRKNRSPQKEKCWAWICTPLWLWEHSWWETVSTEVRGQWVIVTGNNRASIKKFEK